MTPSQRYRLRATEAARNGEDQWSVYYRHLANALRTVETPRRNAWRQTIERRIATRATPLRFVHRAVESVLRTIAARRARRAEYAALLRFVRHES